MNNVITHRYRMSKKALQESVLLFALATVPWILLRVLNVFTDSNLYFAVGIGLVISTLFLFLGITARKQSQLFAKISDDGKTITVWMQKNNPQWGGRLVIVKNILKVEEFKSANVEKINKNEVLTITKQDGTRFWLPQRLGVMPEVKEFFEKNIDIASLSKTQQEIITDFFNGVIIATAKYEDLKKNDKAKTIEELIQAENEARNAL